MKSCNKCGKTRTELSSGWGEPLHCIELRGWQSIDLCKDCERLLSYWANNKTESKSEAVKSSKKNEIKLEKGLSASVIIGKWKGLKIRWSDFAIGLVVGWVAVTVWSCDIEQSWKALSKITDK